ncbi:MAG TPA: MBL fold metallo-hydrolase [Methanoregula sp.]|nr:MBL fold metallo-hydrolase [Methanoregula sp.]
MLIVLVFLAVLVTAGCTGSGTMTADAAGSGHAGIRQAGMPALPAGVPLLKGTRRGVTAGHENEVYRTRLVLLGTAGGPTWYSGTGRASSSSALVVGDSIYIIDLGQGSTRRLSEAFNAGMTTDGTSSFLQDVKGLFFTHLHQDHTADYPAFLLIGPQVGLGAAIDPVTNRTISRPLPVYGPGDRGQREADTSGYLSRGGQIVMTDSAGSGTATATPGTRQMTEHIWQAYALTLNDMTLDNGVPDYTSLVDVREIGGTGPNDIRLPVAIPDPNNGTCPAMEPFEVFRDENVRVTAILVDHHQVFPAFAYRFDTADGSVVFSGDTGPDTNGNLQKLASGADILVHEAIDPAWPDLKFGVAAPGSPLAALKAHLLESHTTPAAAGQVATDCGVKTLVLSHLIPANGPPAHLEEARNTFTGRLVIGDDLMVIGLGRPA